MAKKQDKPKGRGSRTARKVQATEHLPPPRVPDVTVGPEPDDDPWDSEGMTVRQRLFVDSLLGPAGGNASRAAELAGYSAENRHGLAATASRLLTFVKVREAIARRLASANLTPDWVRQTAASLAASSMGTFLSLDENGQPKFNWREAERLGAFVQIRKYKEKGFESPGSSVSIIERTIETHNPAPYLALLARLLGLVKDDGTAGVNVSVNVTQLSDDELVRIITAHRPGGGRTAEPAACPVGPDGVR